MARVESNWLLEGLAVADSPVTDATGFIAELPLVGSYKAGQFAVQFLMSLISDHRPKNLEAYWFIESSP